jgi:large subunit ribosomal protein L25
VPGIIYGGDKSPEMIATRHNELQQHLEHEAFYSHILTVKVDGKPQRVVLKDLQRHPAKPFIQHLDLLRVAESDRIKMNVPLHFLNEDTAPGVKAGGKVSHTLTDVEIICEAGDLPEYIEVDLAGMELGDTLHLSDLQLPKGVEIPALTHGDEHDTGVVAVHAPKGAAADEEESEGEEDAGE